MCLLNKRLDCVFQRRLLSKSRHRVRYILEDQKQHISLFSSSVFVCSREAKALRLQTVSQAAALQHSWRSPGPF